METPPELPDKSSHEQPSLANVASTPGGRFGLVLTNLGKLAGLVGGIHEAAGPARPAAVLFWVSLFLGAQALEDLLGRLIDRAMGK